ncbi:hypothetical protein JCM5353_002230 [Sporobolomyces roseus]
MASLKIGSLLLRTLSKPIANKIKQRAKDHEGFKTRTVWLAQLMHRTEMNLRVSLLGESPKHIRPLSEARAIESGANFLSEGFLFTVAATIIIGETYRSSLKESKRRDQVRESLITHEMEIEELRERLKDVESNYEGEKERGRELSSILEEVVMIGLKGGFAKARATAEEVEDDRDNWERHLRVGELARRFGTNERVLRDEEEEEEETVDVPIPKEEQEKTGKGKRAELMRKADDEEPIVLGQRTDTEDERIPKLDQKLEGKLEPKLKSAGDEAKEVPKSQ